jgi:hypothetical protein
LGLSEPLLGKNRPSFSPRALLKERLRAAFSELLLSAAKHFSIDSEGSDDFDLFTKAGINQCGGNVTELCSVRLLVSIDRP